MWQQTITCPSSTKETLELRVKNVQTWQKKIFHTLHFIFVIWNILVLLIISCWNWSWSIFVLLMFSHRINELHTAISIKNTGSFCHHFASLRCMSYGSITLLRLSTTPIVTLYSWITSGFSIFCFVWKWVLPVSTNSPVYFVDIIDTISIDLIFYGSSHLQTISSLQNFTFGGSPTPLLASMTKNLPASLFSPKFHIHQFYFQITFPVILAMYRDYPRLNYIQHCKTLQEDSK